MAYKITYGPPASGKWNSPQRWAAVILAVCILVVGCYLVGEWESVQRLLIPGDVEVTQAALNTFAQQLEQGETIGRAFACFCKEIIENARTE